MQLVMMVLYCGKGMVIAVIEVEVIECIYY